MANRMNPPVIATPGATLRRWRVLRRIKQAHAAEWLGVSQSTISRWEAGTLPITGDALARIEALFAARLDSAADHALQRLVTHDARAVHLVCDHTHRLLACSASRAAEFSQPLPALMGVSLWPFATEAIVTREASLRDAGWYEQRTPSIEFDTGSNDSLAIPIRESRCRWTRLTLSDGTVARLVETLQTR
ncbi:transcriptional regulator [Pandoraea iniqua]|uniref:helix-turn-helix domain-containing protein n=1 Tax=Pandoraea iniqua TaxID=2508288 RepID=UPI00125B5776|nr:helix-turn-helix transcriptional regulator [Pandoraea iniqua]VVE25110.1 transcriptional regulator [Pandoraea iniqua]